jgi:FMN-binding protein
MRRNMKARFLFLPLASIVVPGGPAYATVFLTIEQAKALMFPGAAFTPEFHTLTVEQTKAIERNSGVSVRNKEVKIWHVSTGGWFILDEVVGKHEYIPFALALDDKGAVKGVEVLEYREAYGDQIRGAEWRYQFFGKQPGSRLRLNKEIRNISGATLSCRHVTDGITRLLATYATLFEQSGR